MRSCSRCKTPYTTLIEFCGLDGAPVVETARDPLLGVTFDRYLVTERLGGGGMAAVYRASHQVIEREVAIKVLYGELAADRAFAERFRREAQAASRIKHPNVVEILDFGATPEGMSFLVMEFMRGETLSDAIQRSGPFAPRRAAAVLRQVAAGLGAAHASGFVHRDLKPGNIMLVDASDADGPREFAKILDFGLVQARSSGKESDEERLTRTGQTLGTPFYMAPEQFQGEDATPLSDLYSLGAVLYEMLAGNSPFRGSLGEVVVQHASSKPPPLAPAGGLEGLAKKLLEKQPKKRPQSADAVIAAVDALALGPVQKGDIPPRAPTLELSLHEVMVIDAPSSPELPHVNDDDTTVPDEERPKAPTKLPPDVPLTAFTERRERSGRGSRTVVAALVLGAAALTIAVWRGVIPAPTSLVDVVDAPPAVDVASARVERTQMAVSADLDAALARRGMSRADATELDALAPLLARFDATLPTDVTAADALLHELVPEIARARIDPRLIASKLARLSARLHDDTLPLAPKRRAALVARMVALEKEVTLDLSEAERSRLVLRIFALEQESAPSTTTDAR
jgi:serine/threonine protein kinase